MLATLASCSVDKFLQPGESVLYDNRVNLSMADSNAVPDEVGEVLDNVRQYYVQKPNSRILGMRPMLWLYSMTNPADSSWWAKFWRSQGEAPVVYDPTAAQSTAVQLAMLFKTKGCFNTQVHYDTTMRSNRSLVVNYNIEATRRRVVDDLRYRCRQADINDLLQRWKEDSHIKIGDYYDQQKLSEEQVRIATNLQNEGYYYATADLVRFIVDTTYDSHSLSVTVVVRLPQRLEGDSLVQNIPLKQYSIGNIFIYPNITTSLDGHRVFDTLVYPYQTRLGLTNYYFIYDKKITPSPKSISRSMFIFNGMKYRPRAASSTSSSLFGLHNFKYVDIKFEESPMSTDSNGLLDVRIRLLNSPRRRLSLSFEVTNASNSAASRRESETYFRSGNFGLGATLGYQNTNLFGGAEVLNVEGNLVFDSPKDVFLGTDRSFQSLFSTFENGMTATLDLPLFLLPFADRIQWQRNRPHTLIGLNANYQFRQLSIPNFSTGEKEDVVLDRIRFGGSFGYTWNHRRTTFHKLLPINLSFSHTLSGHEYYEYLYRQTANLQFFYEAFDYMLLNTHYEYTYSDQTMGSRNDFNYLRFSVETAGNLLNGFNRLVGHDDETINGDDLLYYQYFRLEGEFKRYIYLGQKSTLVLRALVGLGVPYGHSTFLPYEKIFIGGGPTTMRGWALRHLGAGQYFTDDTKYYFGTGETQLVVNVEHRFPLIGIFEGAVFSDLGNVWSYRDWGIGKGNSFNKEETIDKLALDAGIGLRANISVITLRVDVAVPIFDPSYIFPEARWITSNWSWNNIVFSWGINYPF